MLREERLKKYALENILSMERRLPEGFGPQKELDESRMEKYGNTRNQDDFKKSRINTIEPGKFVELLSKM